MSENQEAKKLEEQIKKRLPLCSKEQRQKVGRKALEEINKLETEVIKLKNGKGEKRKE